MENGRQIADRARPSHTKTAILMDGGFPYFPRSFSAWAMLSFSQW